MEEIHRSLKTTNNAFGLNAVMIPAKVCISKRAKTWYDKLGVPEFIGSVQLSAILGTAHLLRKVLCL